MEIVLGHVDVGMADDALDGGKINAQSLKLTDVGMSAAVGRQDTHALDFTDCSLEFVPEVGRIAGLIFFAYLPDKGSVSVPQPHRAPAQVGRYRYIPVAVPGLGLSHGSCALDHVDGLTDVNDRAVLGNVSGLQGQKLLGSHTGTKQQPDAKPDPVLREIFHNLTSSAVNASLRFTGPLERILSANRTGFFRTRSLASAL